MAWPTKWRYPWAQYKREYRAWCAARNRCIAPHAQAYSRYGGRGITMDPLWLDDFDRFMDDMGPCPQKYTLERDEVNGPYSPENCRWATRGEQSRNMRTNRYLTFQGRTMIATDWAREIGCDISTVFWRMKQGKPIEEILAPVKVKEYDL